MKFLVLISLVFAVSAQASPSKNKPTLLECIRKMEGVAGYSDKVPLATVRKSKARGEFTEAELNKIMLYRQASEKHNNRFIRIIEVNSQILGLSEVRDKDPLTMKLETTNILTGEVKTEFINETDVIDVTILESGALVGLRAEGASTEIFVKMGELDVIQRHTIEGIHIDSFDVLKVSSNKTILAGLTKSKDVVVEGEKEKLKIHPVIFLIELDFKHDQITAGQVTYKHSFWSTLFPVSNKKRILVGEKEYKYIELDGQIHFIDSNGALVGVFAHEALFGTNN
ncbi:MAG: hypothetical protein IPM57_03485 [Oligoflexia bacterium]|nr:hypothetical protein [Oligoflexia bacterium]